MYNSNAATKKQKDELDYFPADCHSRHRWLIKYARVVKPHERLRVHVHWKGRRVKVYHETQTAPATPYDLAKRAYLERFVARSSNERHLKGSEPIVTVQGKLSTNSVDRALRGGEPVGVFGSATTSWAAIDLDLHLGTGGHKQIWLRQLNALLDKFWGNNHSQLVVARRAGIKINGAHLYLYLDEQMPLVDVRKLLREMLGDLQSQHPELQQQIIDWNASGGNVKQLSELEIYPDEKHGFRLFGHSDKTVIAHQEIGYVQAGEYLSGRRKGKPRLGFDLLSWVDSFDKKPMPVDEIIELILPRLPRVDFLQKTENVILPAEPKLVVTEKPISAGSWRGMARPRLIAYWSGNCPVGKLDEMLLVTARFFRAYGLDQGQAIDLLTDWCSQLPATASSRLATPRKMAADINKLVRHVWVEDRLWDVAASVAKLNKSITAWGSYGFVLHDRATWNAQPGTTREVIKPVWSSEDVDIFNKYVAPVFNVHPAKAVDVITSIVELVQEKERQGNGMSYEYWSTWLADYGVAAKKRNKITRLIKTLREVGVIDLQARAIKGVRGRAWSLGDRARRATASGT